MLIAGVVLMLRQPELLRKRLDAKEKQVYQKVVDTGLYGIVRHPMYAATLVLSLSMPLVLASPWSFLIMLLYIPIIAKRIRNEEAVLEQGLEGNTEYNRKFGTK